MRRGVDAVDVEGLLLRNSQARLAHFRATEDSRRTAGFLVGMCVLAVYSCAFVVSVMCTCNDPGECGCSPSRGVPLAHASTWLDAPAACGCLK